MPCEVAPAPIPAGVVTFSLEAEDDCEVHTEQQHAMHLHQQEPTGQVHEPKLQRAVAERAALSPRLQHRPSLQPAFGTMAIALCLALVVSFGCARSQAHSNCEPAYAGLHEDVAIDAHMTDDCDGYDLAHIAAGQQQFDDDLVDGCPTTTCIEAFLSYDNGDLECDDSYLPYWDGHEILCTPEHLGAAEA